MTTLATPPRIKKGDDQDDDETSSVRTDSTTVPASNVRRVALSQQDNMEDQRIPTSAAAAAPSWTTLMSAMQHDANRRNAFVEIILVRMRLGLYGLELRLDTITRELEFLFPEHIGVPALIRAGQEVVRFYNDLRTRNQAFRMVSAYVPGQLAAHFNVMDVVVAAGDGEASSLSGSIGVNAGAANGMPPGAAAVPPPPPAPPALAAAAAPVPPPPPAPLAYSGSGYSYLAGMGAGSSSGTSHEPVRSDPSGVYYSATGSEDDASKKPAAYLPDSCGRKPPPGGGNP